MKGKVTIFLESENSEQSKIISDKFEDIIKIPIDTLTNLYDNLHFIINDEKVISQLQDFRYRTLAIYWTHTNTILTSLKLILNGNTNEAMMLMRNGIEGFAVCLQISLDEKKYNSFISDPVKYDSPKAISEAKKYNSMIGKSYGLLNNYTHTSNIHLFPNLFSKGFFVGSGYSDEDSVYIKQSLIIISYCIESCYSLFEFSYYDIIQNHIYWKLDLDNNQMVFTNSNNEKMLFKYLNEVLDFYKEKNK